MSDLGSQIDYMQFKGREKNLRSSAKFDPLEALRLRDAGYSAREISEMLKREGEVAVSPSAILQGIKRLTGVSGVGKKYIKNYKERVIELLSDKHTKALEAITDEKLEMSSAKDNALISKLLHEQLRLENNQSTQNNMSFLTLVEQSMPPGEL